MTELLAVTPLAFVLVMLVVFRQPALRTMPIALLMTVAIALFYWQMPGRLILAAGVEGMAIAAQILYIVLGALLLLFLMLHSGLVHPIRSFFATISPDPRVQVVIVAWAFGTFIEGISGFGTPAAVAAPLLMLLGFPAMAAVVMTLIIQSTPVSFGAMGTPILLGVHSGLSGSQLVDGFIQDSQFASIDQLVLAISHQVAILHALIGTVIPVIAVTMLTCFFGPQRSWRAGFEAAPFALFGGVCFSLTYVLVAFTLGPEFPSMIGGLVALVATITAAHYGFLTPQSEWRFAERSDWPSEWSGDIDYSSHGRQAEGHSLIKAVVPYLLVAGLLLLSRLRDLPIRDALSSVVVSIDGLFGTEVSFSLVPLMMPGTVFLLAVIVCMLVYRLPAAECRRIGHDAGSALIAAAPVLLCAVPMVRILIRSQTNAAGLDSMPVEVAAAAADAAGQAWPAFTAVVGALGAFIAGSNTISNMTYSLFQFGIAVKTELSPVLIVALQAVGGAAGNMICIHNIVAASATCGIVGREGMLIRKTLIPTLYYLAMAGLIGLLLAAWHGDLA